MSLLAKLEVQSLAVLGTDLRLAGDVNLRDLGTMQVEWTLVIEGFGADLVQFTTFGVNHPAGADIDGKGEEDDKPDGAVKDGDSKKVPAQRDPTPQLIECLARS